MYMYIGIVYSWSTECEVKGSTGQSGGNCMIYTIHVLSLLHSVSLFVGFSFALRSVAV